MVKAYLRYELAGSFGVVNSDCNVVANGNYIVSAALENIIIWNARLGTQVLRWFSMTVLVAAAAMQYNIHQHNTCAVSIIHSTKHSKHQQAIQRMGHHG